MGIWTTSINSFSQIPSRGISTKRIRSNIKCNIMPSLDGKLDWHTSFHSQDRSFLFVNVKNLVRIWRVGVMHCWSRSDYQWNICICNDDILIFFVFSIQGTRTVIHMLRDIQNQMTIIIRSVILGKIVRTNRIRRLNRPQCPNNLHICRMIHRAIIICINLRQMPSVSNKGHPILPMPINQH
ncbi:hypothetical protein V8G54_004122 [Vigna mungo]|uniref:Uncharacterized protein n=1 Tax=Vigna mungo TaxID=3915 RepID=A0AAQ3SDV2_VIGMU